MYCFARWRHSTRGLTPDVPASCPFLVVAHHWDSQWCLLSLGTGIHRLPPRTQPTTQELRQLLESSEAFPPALALAAHELKRRRRPQRSPDEISDALVRSLRRHLRRQPSTPYLLAEARRTELGYLDAGDFVWILGIRFDPRSRRYLASWVSSDFNIYSNPARDFRIPKAARPFMAGPFAV